jgi:hypothetical protein
MARPYRVGRCIALAILLTTALASTVRAEPAQPQNLVDAVWKVQQMNFAYRGYSTVYTCTGLRDKLEVIFKTLGARDGIEITTYDCNDGSGQARFRIAFLSPVEATEENVRALTTYDSKQVLIARSRGEPLPTAEDLPRFQASWQTISFARDRKMRLSPGDCELVQQLRRFVLPYLSVRVEKDNVRCSQTSGNISAPRLTVAALIAADLEPEQAVRTQK